MGISFPLFLYKFLSGETQCFFFFWSEVRRNVGHEFRAYFRKQLSLEMSALGTTTKTTNKQEDRSKTQRQKRHNQTDDTTPFFSSLSDLIIKVTKPPHAMVSYPLF